MKSVFLARCAVFAALMCICAWISIPLGGVVFTMQSFALFLALLVLGGKGATVSIFVYLALGAVGLPIFSGFQGGFSALFGVTGGFLWGFLLGCGAFWLICTLLGEKWRMLGCIACLCCVYLCGTIWYFVYAPGGLWAVLAQSVLPYLLPDAMKLLLAFWLAKRIKIDQ